MLKQCMSTRRFLATPLLQRELGFRDKSGPIEYVHLEDVLVVAPSAALGVFREVTTGIFPRPASVQPHLPTAIKQKRIAGLRL
jgi:hypothetical protein